jgi:hypothetical protein
MFTGVRQKTFYSAVTSVSAIPKHVVTPGTVIR